MFTKKMSQSLVSLVVVLFVSSSLFAGWVNWDGDTGASDNWAWYMNWDINALPGAGDTVAITDAAPSTGIAVVYGGDNPVISDFLMYANAGTGDDVSLTIKSDASLHVNYNIDLGYYGGSEMVTLNVEAGASLSCDGSFLGGRAGLHTVNVAGTITGGAFGLSGATLIDFTATTGLIQVGGDYASLVNDYWAGTLILDRGVSSSDAGWGTTHGIVATYDDTADVTTIATIPEPASVILLSLGGLVLRRRRN